MWVHPYPPPHGQSPSHPPMMRYEGPPRSYHRDAEPAHYRYPPPPYPPRAFAPSHHDYSQYHHHYGYAHRGPPPPPLYEYEYYSPDPRDEPHIPETHEAAVDLTSSPSSLPLSLASGGCTCKKSKCLKLYCQCFSSSTTCGPKCKCQDCHNSAANSADINEARASILERNPCAFDTKTTTPVSSPPSPKAGCKCRRSCCLKKYCECFSNGNKCNDSCGCVNCQNTVPPASTPPPPPQDRMAIMAAVAMTELLGVGMKRTLDAASPDSVVMVKKIKTGAEPTPLSLSSSPLPPASPSANMSSSPRASPLPSSGYYGTHRPSFPNFKSEGQGLPKSLSFRKICSKCGKTRGEHGELGFGHRCVYQDCGKCGAGVQMHAKRGVPMGVLCSLTEKEGAIPGHAAGYVRKIADLAARAELQQRIQKERTGSSAEISVVETMV